MGRNIVWSCDTCGDVLKGSPYEGEGVNWREIRYGTVDAPAMAAILCLSCLRLWWKEFSAMWGRIGFHYMTDWIDQNRKQERESSSTIVL